jgi:hypothetical protein
VVTIRFLAATFALLLLFALSPVYAQPQCGYARAVQFPVDTATFVLAQDFGAASPRHQGRFHTGEDWTLPGGAALGQTVVAPADGRVTFSSANAWGGDGGVIILEHTFPDGSVAYSMFGHLSEAGGITFPPALSCVRRGEMLATIADVRPAPHVHFEIRTSGGAIPGAGYTWDEPNAVDLRRPTKFLLNQALQLADSYRWRADLADEAGPLGAPVLLDDLSLVYLDGQRVNRLTRDGRVLWRAALDAPAVGLFPRGDGAWVVFADGRWQAVLRDGTLDAVIDTGVALARVLLAHDERLIAQTAAGQIAAFDRMGSPQWQSQRSLPSVIAASVEPSSGRLALMAHAVQGGGELLLLNDNGEELTHAQLAQPAPFAFAPSGWLWAYTQGGLWMIDPAGEWTAADDGAHPGGANAALAFADDGSRAQFDGETLIAWNADDSPRWQAAPGSITGQNTLSAHDGRLLLISGSGDVVAWRMNDGAECGRARLWGGPAAWANLGGDGLLRVYIADQVAALDWDEFTQVCG